MSRRRPDRRLKNLVRRREDRMIAGVCSGAADYLGVDPTVVRLTMVLAAVVSLGSAAVVYLAAWVLMPEV